jgi:MFS family permease
VCLSFVFVESYLAIILTFVLYGLHKGALEPAQKTLVSELAPAEYRASGLGAFQMVIGILALPSSFMAGVLWVNVSLFAPFCFSLGLTLLSIVMLLFVKER